MPFKRPLIYLLVLVWFCAAALPGTGADGQITQAEIKQVINEYSQCDSLDQIAIDHLEYFDFFGDGHKEAVVVASTCMTGTAGPDVHAVYTRNAAGKVLEVPFHHAEGDPFFNNDGPKLPLFGNRNYALEIDNGALIARWSDSSDRDSPLVVWYKWNGKAFVVDRMKAEGPFPTSYDCTKATNETDEAICYSPKVAALDLQLSEAYRDAMQQRTSDQRQVLQAQQRQWLAQRDKQCTIYKWWVDCLTELYTKRVAELKKH